MQYPSTVSLREELDTNSLKLEDLVHLETVSYSGLPYPPPIIAQEGPDLLAPSLSSRSILGTAYSEQPSLDFMAPICSPSVSTPPLSLCGSSGSESNLPSFSQNISLGDIIRLSSSPPLAAKKEESTPQLWSPSVGIQVDINMREQELAGKPSPMCVDPTEVMTDSLKMYRLSMSPSPPPDLKGETPALRPHSSQNAATATLARSSSQRDLSPAPDYRKDFPDEALIDNTFPDEAISAIVSVLKSTVKPEANDGLGLSIEQEATALPPQAFVNPKQLVSNLAGPTTTNACLGNRSVTPNRHAPDLPAAVARVPLAGIPAPQPLYPPTAHMSYVSTAYPLETTPTYRFPHPAVSPPETIPAAAPVTTPQSPVLNAHAGIELEDLRQRALEFRERNPGAELDKAFLQCFAGRLSARGELLEDYRCYVVGCEQRNKRRDHILVHVGSHVEHRPWTCQHWCVV